MRSLAMERGIAYEVCFVASALVLDPAAVRTLWESAKVRVEVAEGVESFVLAGAAEIDGPVSTVGLAALRSFTSKAASRIPIPIRATTVTAAARPRLRRGSAGR